MLAIATAADKKPAFIRRGRGYVTNIYAALATLFHANGTSITFWIDTFQIGKKNQYMNPLQPINLFLSGQAITFLRNTLKG
jgi:hypothetical protein